MASKPITIDAAIANRRLLGAALGDLSTWSTWIATLKAAYGRPLTKAERVAFDRVAGGRSPPRRKVKELVVVASRRAGKGRAAGMVAAYEAVLAPHAGLAPGEKGIVAAISPTKEQSQIMRSYAEGFLRSSPVMAGEVADVVADEIRLENGNSICTLTSDYRSLRGRTLLLAVLDEAAFLRSADTASPDIETARALLPGLATTGGILMTLSSPFKRSGLLFERHRDFFGVDDDDVLVVAGASNLFNPTLDQAMLDAARAADPEGAGAEWFGEFRRDHGALFDDETIERATDRNRPLELPPRRGVRYVAYVDAAAGGGSGDAYTVGIAHKETDGDLVVDVCRGVSGRFDPAEVTRGYAGLLREYGIATVTGDNYAPGWVEGAWREHGIAYRRDEENRSALYLTVAAQFNRGMVKLPDQPRLLRELRQLERRVARSGRETVDHPNAATDDFALVACGAIRNASTAAPALWASGDLVGDHPVQIPSRADVVFACAIAGERGLAVTYLSRWNVQTPQLIVLDYDLLPMVPASVHAVILRLLDFAGQMRDAPAYLFTTSRLAPEFRRMGHAVEILDGMVKDELLAVSAAVHVGAGRVKLSVLARARSATVPLGLLDGSVAGDDDPVRMSVLAGIAIALDAKREAA